MSLHDKETRYLRLSLDGNTLFSGYFLGKNLKLLRPNDKNGITDAPYI